MVVLVEGIVSITDADSSFGGVTSCLVGEGMILFVVIKLVGVAIEFVGVVIELVGVVIELVGVVIGLVGLVSRLITLDPAMPPNAIRSGSQGRSGASVTASGAAGGVVVEVVEVERAEALQKSTPPPTVDLSATASGVATGVAPGGVKDEIGSKSCRRSLLDTSLGSSSLILFFLPSDEGMTAQECTLRNRSHAVASSRNVLGKYRQVTNYI